MNKEENLPDKIPLTTSLFEELIEKSLVYEIRRLTKSIDSEGCYEEFEFYKRYNIYSKKLRMFGKLIDEHYFNTLSEDIKYYSEQNRKNIIQYSSNLFFIISTELIPIEHTPIIFNLMLVNTDVPLDPNWYENDFAFYSP